MTTAVPTAHLGELGLGPGSFDPPNDRFRPCVGLGRKPTKTRLSIPPTPIIIITYTSRIPFAPKGHRKRVVCCTRA